MKTASNIELSPAYDLISTAVYPHFDERLAMAIGGQCFPDRVLKANWKKFCEEIDFSYPGFSRIALELMEVTLRMVQQLKQEMMESRTWTVLLDSLEGLIEKQAAFLVNQLV